MPRARVERVEVGSNFPYDARDGGAYRAPAETWDRLHRINPDSIVIPSHAAPDDYRRLIDEFDWLSFTIRAKTGPANTGRYPSNILDYDEWRQPDGTHGEQTLGEAIELVKSAGRVVRVSMGTEPCNEMAREPTRDATNRDQAIKAYVDWYFAEVPRIRQEFSGVQICPAPLSQGDPVNAAIWRKAFARCYSDGDFIGLHCYRPFGTALDDPDWLGGWVWYRNRYQKKRIRIFEINLNGPGSAADYVEAMRAIIATGDVDEVDVFTVGGGADDDARRANNQGWWFIDEATADAIGVMDRSAAVIAEPPSEEPPAETPPAEEPPSEPGETPPSEEPIEVSPLPNEPEAANAALNDLWYGSETPGDRDPANEMPKYWHDHISEMGSCLGPERYAYDGDGNVIAIYQAFAGGVWVARPGDPWTVEKFA